MRNIKHILYFLIFPIVIILSNIIYLKHLYYFPVIIIYFNAIFQSSFHPEITIIIPCYQKAQYLTRAFRSCIDDQDIKKNHFTIEIICINDASTDNTLYVLSNLKKKYESNYCHIKVYNFKVHKCTLFARLFALNHSKGDYIMSLDEDDEFIPRIMNKLLSLTKKYKYIDIIQFRLLLVYLQIEKSRKYKNKYKYDYTVLSYGEYPFKIIRNIQIRESILKHKYFLINDSINDIKQLKYINSKDLQKMCVLSQVMWNLAGLFLKRSLVLKAIHNIFIRIDVNNFKLTNAEDKLIAYYSYYFCENFYFLDDIGYIYHRGTKRVKVYSNETVFSLIEDLFSQLNLSKMFGTKR